MNKKDSRIRRGLKAKALIRKSGRPRLVVHRSNVHIYAQIVAEYQSGNKVLVSASTVDKELKGNLSDKTKVEQATLVGQLIGKRAIDKGLSEVSFDRGGNKYHGRVKALADGAREAKLVF